MLAGWTLRASTSISSPPCASTKGAPAPRANSARPIKLAVRRSRISLHHVLCGDGDVAVDRQGDPAQEHNQAERDPQLSSTRIPLRRAIDERQREQADDQDRRDYVEGLQTDPVLPGIEPQEVPGGLGDLDPLDPGG